MDSEYATYSGTIILSKYIWSKEEIPHKGWHCKNIVDTGCAKSKCEMCGNGTVRYVHYLEHDNYPDLIEVGSECSRKLAENYSMASFLDTYIKKYPTEKITWANKNWKISRSGNPYLQYNDYTITIYKDKYKLGNFKFITVKKEITNIDYGEGPEQEEEDIKFFSKNSYNSIAEAKEAVFDHFFPKDISAWFNC
jgi:hypothetical protein